MGKEVSPNSGMRILMYEMEVEWMEEQIIVTGSSEGGEQKLKKATNAHCDRLTQR